MSFEWEWEHRKPVAHDISLQEVEGWVERALGWRPHNLAKLDTGHSNLSLRFDDGEGASRFVVRFFLRDPSSIQREAALMRQVAKSRISVPEVVHEWVSQDEASPSFLILRWVEGMMLDHALLQTSSDDATVKKLGRLMGLTLAELGSQRYNRAGWLGLNLDVERPLDDMRRAFLDHLDKNLDIASSQRRLPADLRRGLRDLPRKKAHLLEPLEWPPRLVHGDFKLANIIVSDHNRDWELAALLDWEFAFSGPPVFDFATLIRWEHALPDAFVAGISEAYNSEAQQLPEGWRSSARLIDLANLTSLLADEGDKADTVVAGGRLDHPRRTQDILSMIYRTLRLLS